MGVNIGDIVTCTVGYLKRFTRGKQYKVYALGAYTGGGACYRLINDEGTTGRAAAAYFKSILLEDKLRHIVRCETDILGLFTKGKLYRVNGLGNYGGSHLGSYYNLDNDKGVTNTVSSSHFKLVEHEGINKVRTINLGGAMKEDKDDWREHSFSIRSKDGIDNESIREDLSLANPMMILEVEGSKQVRVFLHQSIWHKATNSGKHWRELLWVGSDITISTYEYSERLDKFLSMDNWIRKDLFLNPLIKLIKEIKAAEWEKPCKAKVTVRKISI